MERLPRQLARLWELVLGARQVPSVVVGLWGL